MDEDTFIESSQNGSSSNSNKSKKVTTTSTSSSSNNNSQKNQNQILQDKLSQKNDGIGVTDMGGKKTRRLMIKMMELENFKSYAGKQVIGPFHKCFTSVIGPNGSGKSNVIDAMLFVFGRRAKQIRLNKVSELVHNSSQHRNVQSARVSVYFHDIIDHEDTDDYEVVDGTELVVTRTANKKNESHYYINGEKSSFTAVTELLKGRGIDLDNNRFLILQGEVEQIALMKPKAQNPSEEGLLEYLEDIIGSNRFVTQIEDSYKAVERINEDRTSIMNRVKLIEKERESLEESKNEAEGLLRFELDKIEIKSAQIQIRRYQAEQSNQSHLDAREQLEKKLAKEKAASVETREKLKEFEKTLKAELKIKETLNAALERCKDEHQALQKRIIKNKEEMKHLKTMTKKNETVLQDEETRGAELSANIKKLKDDIIKNEKESALLPKKLVEAEKELEEMLESLKGETGELQAEMEEQQKQLMPWSKKYLEIKSKVDIQQSEIDVLSKDFNVSQQRLDEANQALDQTKVTVDQRTKEIAAAKKELETIKSGIKSIESELKQVKQQEEQVYSQLQQKRISTEEIRSQLTESNSRNTVLDRLMRLKETGQIPGIHGRLGDLGAIDKKYDVAISTACPSLENIVVDTTATAEQCVEVLRRESLGRATFIIIDKISYLDKQTEKIDTPDNTPRLFDLIKMKDNMYATAFYYALRDTLVADDLDKATKVAYGSSKRYRVVTLDGSLIDTSGAMSGGGSRVMRGAMGSKLQANPIEEKKKLGKLDEEIKQLSAEMQSIRSNKTELESQLATAMKRKSELELELPKMEMDIKAAHKKSEELSKAIPELQKQVKAASARQSQVEQLKQALAGDLDEFHKLKGKVEKLEKVIQDVQNKIINIGGSKLKKRREKVEQLQQQIDECQRTITKSHVQIKSSEKSIEKSKRIVEENQRELAENQEQIEKLKLDQETIKVEGEELNVRFQKADEDLNQKDTELVDVKKEQDKLKKIEQKATLVELDIQNSIDDVTRIIKENQDKAASLMKRFDDLNKSKQSYKILDSDPDEPLKVFSTEELVEMSESYDDLTKKYESIDLQLKNSAGKLNIGAIKEYRAKDEDYKRRQKELDDITEQRDNHRRTYDNLRKNRLDEFMNGFQIITNKLKEMYQMITFGGDAELELADQSDPFSEGIIFSVRPPKKSWKNISNLSGGEKTLSSLSLVFALHHYKPTPLYVMDEIDAALDYRNVSIVAHYIQKRTKNAQFVIISLRNYMFELADRLVGIFKVNHCTGSITINPKSYATQTTEETQKVKDFVEERRIAEAKRAMEEDEELDDDDDEFEDEE
ncbi:structural maintenance of chromosome protein [Heterostelium album PN500]|uniref:Structural maintenance of chromosomes protein n=1 Tax=Heterostelium pallidum (strain ATCC 26659 / Pp 5 / PN500) TaxID=670386 RepID=D3BDE5_HETP5|nr:structural maintenance of chromosome protein [Heterostelium album PN500]EFA80589.1 structural maintenance of chromosome protein [Heterostelium album PN500]|eukprot:XP_020432709.1 structural maintenance of chromosome protein [Heterostelium album PN500]